MIGENIKTYVNITQFKTIEETSAVYLDSTVNEYLKKGWVILRTFESKYTGGDIRKYHVQMGKMTSKDAL